jgi:hypothetical protein
MSNEDKISKGIGVWFAATAAAVITLTFLGGVLTAFYHGMHGTGAIIGLYSLVQVGAWQWLYVIPLIIWLRRKQRFETAKGLLITACVLFGVDVLCSGVVFYSLSHTTFR